MQRLKILVLIACTLLVFSACSNKEKTNTSLEQVEFSDNEESEADSENEDIIFVYVCGAVMSEGVYQLSAGSRVCEAIEKAGGFSEDAARTSVNQAKILVDEECVYIPVIGENVETQVVDDGKININNATKSELMNLPGIGAAKAEGIIDYREKNGAFKTIEDIMNVSGIKQALFEQIKDLIKV